MVEDKDVIAEGKDAFEDAAEYWRDNRECALDDLKFARLGEQWPPDVAKQRALEKRPCLTINKMPAFIRQVVNDARQNKPSIKVHPVDSGADKETAKIFDGLIRNIEYTSNADVAYDTAAECAVANGFGFFRIGLDYAHDDTFDMDISIDRVSNPFSIYPDCYSTAADSSDWNSSFVIQMVDKDKFAKDYNDAQPVDWGGEGYANLADPWMTEDCVMLAEWWTREEYDKPIVLLSDGTVQTVAAMKELGPVLAASGVTVKQQRVAKCWRVKQRIMTGAEVLKEEVWPGQYIPIVPVYGDEVDVEGRRYFRSLIRDAKDAQRMFNYWRTTTTELIALAPKTPFIGPKGAFKTDSAKWSTANTQTHSFIEYDGNTPPQRQPFVGVPAGALQEALNASDDMKAIMGLYDASLGARSNETSGVAINARKREGDVSTFHFQDNESRAICHAGRVLLDLIPKVYSAPRIIRIIGEDGSHTSAPINQPVPMTDEQGKPMVDEAGQAMTRVYSLTSGKYDLTVTTGPSFTTRREEAAAQMTEFIRAYPPAAPVIGDILADNLDWPSSDVIADRLKAINPALKGQGGLPPEVQKQIQDGMAQLQALQQENAALKADKSLEAEKNDIARTKNAIEGQKALTDQYRAETERAQGFVKNTQPHSTAAN